MEFKKIGTYVICTLTAMGPIVSNGCALADNKKCLQEFNKNPDMSTRVFFPENPEFELNAIYSRSVAVSTSGTVWVSGGTDFNNILKLN